MAESCAQTVIAADFICVHLRFVFVFFLCSPHFVVSSRRRLGEGGSTRGLFGFLRPFAVSLSQI
jgi:hypothetical protein